MKFILSFSLLFSLMVGATVPAAAQEEKDFQTWMKSAGASMGALRKAMDAKSGADIASAAQKLDAVFAQVEKFYSARKTADAVELAKTAQSAAKEIAEHGPHGMDISSQFGKLGGTCKGCHEVHREKLPDGTYKFK